MKTTFIRQIIAIAIFSASILCTSGTPLPTSLLTVRDVLPSLPNNASPHKFLIAPRGPVPLAEVVENSRNKFVDLTSTVPAASDDAEKLEALLKMTNTMFTDLVHQQGLHQTRKHHYESENLTSFRMLVHRAVTISSDQLFSALAKKTIPEAKHSSIIRLFIAIANMSVVYHQVTGSNEDWAVRVLETVNGFLDPSIHWPAVAQDSRNELKEVQANLVNREEKRSELRRKNGEQHQRVDTASR